MVRAHPLAIEPYPRSYGADHETRIRLLIFENIHQRLAGFCLSLGMLIPIGFHVEFHVIGAAASSRTSRGCLVLSKYWQRQESKKKHCEYGSHRGTPKAESRLRIREPLVVMLPLENLAAKRSAV